MSNLPAHIPGRALAVETPLTQQFLTLTLGQELFALPIEHIREIIEFGNVATVPLMPDTVRGVINLRGSVVPVVDLVARFGRGQMQTSRRTCVVILEVGQDDDLQVIGMMVDAVNEVLEIAATDIEPPPPFGTHLRTDFIAGMAKAGGRFVILLDAERVLSVTEMATLGTALKPAVGDG